MKSTHLAFWVLAVVLAPPSRAKAQAVAVGMIVSIQGKPTLNPGNRSLKIGADDLYFLYAGDSIKCSQGADVEGILIESNSLQPRPLCNRGVFVAPPGSGMTSTIIALRNGLNEAGRRAGRDKGGESLIFEPAPGGSILPDKLVVRWRTRPPLDQLTLILQSDSGKPLLEIPGIDGSTGTLDSPPLRAALLKLRTDAPAITTAKLILKRPAPEAASTSSFDILSEHQEQELQTQLLQAATLDGPLAHIVRAGIFIVYKAYGQVAAEYGSALEQAPDSVDLLQAALGAYSRIGDLHRAQEISNRLDLIERKQE